MAANVWELVREAIATKAAAVATLRGADTNTDGPGAMFPFLRVLPVSYELRGQPNRNKEEYRLTIPAELLVSRSAGQKRSEPSASMVARDLQEAWWTGVALGMEGTVVRSWIESMTHGLSEYADDGLDGYRITFMADVDEVIPTRT